MTDTNPIIQGAKIFVKTPDVPEGTNAGLGTSIGWFNRNYSFEGVVYGNVGDYKVGIPSVPIHGKLKVKASLDDEGALETKAAVGFDYFKGIGGGIEVTYEGVKFKIGCTRTVIT